MSLTSLKQICNEYLIKFSENQSAPKLENRKTSPCSPSAPNLLHVLVSRILGYHNLCSPDWTLTLPMKIGPDLYKDQLFIGLNTNLTYVVYLHDAEYFLMNENPTSTPSIHRRFTTSAEKTTGWFYKLSLVEVNKLNLPRSPCVEDPSYSFLSCVRRSIASKVRENNISVSLVTKFSKNMCIKIKGWLPNKVGCVERTINTFMYIWGPV